MTEQKVVVIGGGRGFGKTCLAMIALGLGAAMARELEVAQVAQDLGLRDHGKPRGKGKVTKDWQR